MNAVINETQLNKADLITQIRTVIEREGSYVGKVPTSICEVNANLNPRKDNNKEGFETRKADIAKNGIDSSLLLRLTEDNKLEVIGGKTRFTIATELSIPLIPVQIKYMSDIEALHRSGAENLMRADMTPIEEADYCALRLTHLNNDQQELLRELGWSEQKLKSRLPLSRAVKDVRVALTNNQIKLGHAQLLVGLTEDAQTGFLNLIITDSLSVDDARIRLETKQRPLKLACFDTGECKSCFHNTKCYVDLFDTESTSEGDNCRNNRCFEEKTKNRIIELKAQCQDEFGVVMLDMEVTPNSTAMLKGNEKGGVGSHQMTACANCQHFGCIISTLRGNEGKRTEKVCFNLTCHAEKVKAFTSSQRPQLSATEKPSTTAANSKTTGSTKTPSLSNETSAEANTLTRRIKLFSFERYSHLAADLSLQAPQVQDAIGLLTLWRAIKGFSKASSIPITTGETFSDSSTDKEMLSRFLEMSDSDLSAIRNHLVREFINHAETPDFFENDRHNQYTLTILNALEVDFGKYWVVDEDYIALLTKAGIEVLLKQSGYESKFIQVKGEKAFKALLAEKVKEMPGKIMEFKEFDWQGYVPPEMDYRRYTKQTHN